MMKLRHLFDNRDLAHMLLGYWDYDRRNTKVMDHFRISANAVYPFYCGGELLILRFAPVEEKPLEYVRGELEFLHFLWDRGYPAARPVCSKEGEYIVLAQTPWGAYTAAVFEKVQGKLIGECGSGGTPYLAYGKALGRLHRISMEFRPNGIRRPDWLQTLNWCGTTLAKYSASAKALRELERLKKELGSLPKSQSNYGLIHYDFEPDNVFYNDKSGICTPIDFDDAVYHWFVMDIAQSIDSIRDGLPAEYVDDGVRRFLQGYEGEMEIDREIYRCIPLFQRYSNLVSYAKIVRSVEEAWNNEPEWMVNLRKRMDSVLEQRKERFGKPLNI